jgi:hypothetical protein
MFSMNKRNDCLFEQIANQQCKCNKMQNYRGKFSDHSFTSRIVWHFSLALKIRVVVIIFSNYIVKIRNIILLPIS